MTRPTSNLTQRRALNGSPPPPDKDASALELSRSVLPFDVGCAHTLPGHDADGRCQLWVGHQGEHAVMFVRDRIRTVRFWNDGEQRRIHDDTDCRCRPWVYGFPRPAWHEGASGCVDGTADLASGRSLTSQIVADAMVHRPKVEPVTSTVADLRRLFADEHVHAALITVEDVLITVVDRSDIRSALSANTPAAGLGTLLARTVGPTASLEEARQQMTDAGRRRLAVIDEQHRLLGLLCLKRGQDGFCSDQDLRARLDDRRQASGCRSGSAMTANQTSKGSQPGIRRSDQPIRED